jgi:hypothetical protein
MKIFRKKNKGDQKRQQHTSVELLRWGVFAGMGTSQRELPCKIQLCIKLSYHYLKHIVVKLITKD